MAMFAFYNEKMWRAPRIEERKKKESREVEEGLTCESGHEIKESHDRQRWKMECVRSW